MDLPRSKVGGCGSEVLFGKIGSSDEVYNVEFISGTRRVNLTIDEFLDLNVIVALNLNDKPIPVENGGPVDYWLDTGKSLLPCKMA
jgi:DMSO/TMAO reductase YedYZ molybdopterin-dependent catalytic subunit